MSENTSCFRREAYSASKADFQLGQSALFLACSKVEGSVSGLESKDSVVKWTFGCFGVWVRVAGGLVACRF